MIYSLYYSGLDFMGRFFRLVFGFLVAIIIILLFIGTALDIMYLTIPIVQSSIDKLLDGSRLGGFRLLSKDAVLAQEESASSGRHVLFCYLKNRLWMYIISTIVIYLMIMGPTEIVNYLWNFVKYFLKAFGLLT